MKVTLSRYLNVVIASVSICLAAMSAQADELDALKERLRAARTHDDIVKIYQSIDHEFKGDTTKIVDFLRSIGF